MNGFLSITLGDLLERNVRKYPSYLAVKYIEEEYERTYYNFNNDVDQIARGLLGTGLRNGDMATNKVPSYVAFQRNANEREWQGVKVCA